MGTIPFIKMHGIGNDFVIIDQREEKYEFDIKKMADRKMGIGCDQVIIIENPIECDAISIMRIYNADGGEVGACGNATRCLAHLLMKEQRIDHIRISVKDKVLSCWRVNHKTVKVDMGTPLLEWRDIPFSREVDTLNVPITHGTLSDPVAVNMGNPHIVFFVDDIHKVDLDTLGPKLEHHELFPDRINVNIAHVISNDKILMRIWERGVGETKACGSGACATLVAAIRKKYISGCKATISLPGGDLIIAWKKNSVFMTGPIEEVFTGNYKA